MNINYEHFMKTDLRRYSGEWVVIVNSRVVGHGPIRKLKSIVKEVRRKHPKQSLLIGRAPSMMEQIL